MKKVILILLCIVFSFGISANPIDKNQAEQIGRQFMNNNMKGAKGKRNAPSGRNLKYKDCGFKHLWTFEDEDNGGFVVVADNDCLNPVLAYSESDKLNMNNLPEALKILFLGYEQQISSMATAGVSSQTKATKKERKAIAPLIQTLWHQYPPLSYRLPYDDNASHPTLVGCVAVVLAQLMYYYKYPTGTIKTIPAYTTESKGYYMDALKPTTFNYDKMNLCYWNILADEKPDLNDESLQEVTKLLLYCGCALKMDYSFGGSSAQFNLETIADYFGFDRGACQRYAANYSHDVWEQMVYDELAAGRPVPYSAGAVGNQTHLFIVDGYDGKGYFHANYGEVGGRDANSIYCDLGVMDDCQTQTGVVLFSGYNVLQNAYFGFQPNKGNATAESEKEANISASSHLTVDNVSYITPFVNERLKVLVDYTNNGNNYENSLFLWIDNNLDGGVGVYVDPGNSGQSVIYTSVFTKGNHKVKITADEGGKKELYTGTLNVTDEPACMLDFDISKEGVDDNGYLHGQLLLRIKVKNVSENEFSNMINTHIYVNKCDKDGNSITDEANDYPGTVWSRAWFLNLKSQESKEIEYTIDSELLEKGPFHYLPIVFYCNQGNVYQVYGKNYDDGFFYSDAGSVGISVVKQDKLKIGNDETIYNIHGQRIKPGGIKQGIYILQGKKVLVQ